MENVVANVYDTLKESTNSINADIAALDEIEEAVKSHKYSDAYYKNMIIPKRVQLQNSIQRKADEGIKNAKEHVERYRQSIETLDALDPSQLTDDVKLLQPGLSLEKRDYQAMVNRNANNPTMVQLILRHAKDHNVNVGLSYTEREKEKDTADNLDSIIDIYKRWITTPSGGLMLDQFFDGKIK